MGCSMVGKHMTSADIGAQLRFSIVAGVYPSRITEEDGLFNTCPLKRSDQQLWTDIGVEIRTRPTRGIVETQCNAFRANRRMQYAMCTLARRTDDQGDGQSKRQQGSYVEQSDEAPR